MHTNANSVRRHGRVYGWRTSVGATRPPSRLHAVARRADIADAIAPRWHQSREATGAAGVGLATLGRLTVRWLRGAGRSEKQAISHLRAHPELADAKF